MSKFIKTLKPYVYTSAVWIIALSFIWLFAFIDGRHASIPYVQPHSAATTTATSSITLDLSGIENTDKLEKRLNILVDKTRASQSKQRAEQKLQELEKQETSLE